MALSRPERVTLEADEGLLASTVLYPGQTETKTGVTTHLTFFLLVGNTQSLDYQVCPGYLAQYTYISSMSSIDSARFRRTGSEASLQVCIVHTASSAPLDKTRAYSDAPGSTQNRSKRSLLARAVTGDQSSAKWAYGAYQ
jgi:hypothetical protein